VTGQKFMQMKKYKTLSEQRSRASLSRVTSAGGGLRSGSGRRRSKAQRSPCGAMTAKRAKARAHTWSGDLMEMPREDYQSN